MAATKDKCVLIIEDDALNMKLVRVILDLEGYRLVEATDAESGIPLALSEHPDLILMDIQLPGMDGVSAARKLREEHGLTDTPIVAISSYAMGTDVEKAMRAGFADYVTKPIDTKAFPQQIARHMNSQSLENNQ